MDTSRRTFLKAAAGAACAPLLLAACGPGNTAGGNAPSNDPATPKPPDRPQKMGTLLGFGAGTGGLYFIGRTDLDSTGRPTRHQEDIKFLGHGFSPNPAKPHLAVISEKHGKGCVEWDMRAGRVTRKLRTADSREFYGHGAFTPDGRTLFLAESVVGDNSYDGVITVRDGDSYEIKGEFPTYGLAPHDTLLIDDGRTLVVTNGGGPLAQTEPGQLPCVSYVDVKSRELKQRLTFSTPRINAGHLAMTGKGELVVVSAPREGMDKGAADFNGAISFYSPGGTLRTADDPVVRRMKAETLSTAIHEPTMVVAATNPAGNLVTFWDFRTARLIKSIEDYSWPRGISLTLDGRYFVLTYAHETHAVLIDAQKLEPVAGTRIDQTFISGSHNYVYDLPA